MGLYICIYTEGGIDPHTHIHVHTHIHTYIYIHTHPSIRPSTHLPRKRLDAGPELLDAVEALEHGPLDRLPPHVGVGVDGRLQDAVEAVLLFLDRMGWGGVG